MEMRFCYKQNILSFDKSIFQAKAEYYFWFEKYFFQ